MLTIDEMIKLHKMKARASKHFNARTTVSYTAEEHKQLAEFLKELKDYRDKNKMVVRIDCVNSEEFKDIAVKLAKEQYNKAIDDFVNACKEDILCQTFGLHANGIERIAEQLKAGDNNGT